MKKNFKLLKFSSQQLQRKEQEELYSKQKFSISAFLQPAISTSTSGQEDKNPATSTTTLHLHDQVEENEMSEMITSKNAVIDSNRSTESTESNNNAANNSGSLTYSHDMTLLYGQQ